eukprot:TRINITY_DN15589_c0_g1_i1.p1 TRINITY_DN15589_c0_g1~~TRINITY_DN15589_c0_g1_i1.p1  ORF type:complete len:1004 (+),score=358.97 TRINITY_DN15589_c0_g1_i1:55-3066(+)
MSGVRRSAAGADFTPSKFRRHTVEQRSKGLLRGGQRSLPLELPRYDLRPLEAVASAVAGGVSGRYGWAVCGDPVRLLVWELLPQGSRAPSFKLRLEMLQDLLGPAEQPGRTAAYHVHFPNELDGTAAEACVVVPRSGRVKLLTMRGVDVERGVDEISLPGRCSEVTAACVIHGVGVAVATQDGSVLVVHVDRNGAVRRSPTVVRSGDAVEVGYVHMLASAFSRMSWRQPLPRLEVAELLHVGAPCDGVYDVLYAVMRSGAVRTLKDSHPFPSTVEWFVAQHRGEVVAATLCLPESLQTPSLCALVAHTSSDGPVLTVVGPGDSTVTVGPYDGSRARLYVVEDAGPAGAAAATAGSPLHTIVVLCSRARDDPTGVLWLKSGDEPPEVRILGGAVVACTAPSGLLPSALSVCTSGGTWHWLPLLGSRVHEALRSELLGKIRTESASERLDKVKCSAEIANAAVAPCDDADVLSLLRKKRSQFRALRENCPQISLPEWAAISCHIETVAVLIALRELQETLSDPVERTHFDVLLHAFADSAPGHSLRSPTQRVYSDADGVRRLPAFLLQWMQSNPRASVGADVVCSLVTAVLDARREAEREWQREVPAGCAWTAEPDVAAALSAVAELLSARLQQSPGARFVNPLELVATLEILDSRERDSQALARRVMSLLLSGGGGAVEPYSRKALGWLRAEKLGCSTANVHLLVLLYKTLPPEERRQKMHEVLRRFGARAHDSLVSAHASPHGMADLLDMPRALDMGCEDRSCFRAAVQKVLAADPLLYAAVGPYGSASDAAEALRACGDALLQRSTRSPPDSVDARATVSKLARFAGCAQPAVDRVMAAAQVQRLMLGGGSALSPDEIFRALTERDWTGDPSELVAGGHPLVWAFVAGCEPDEDDDSRRAKALRVWQRALQLPEGWHASPQAEQLEDQPDAEQRSVLVRTVFYQLFQTVALQPHLRAAAFVTGPASVLPAIRVHPPFRPELLSCMLRHCGPAAVGHSDAKAP